MVVDFEAEKRESETARIRRRKAESEWLRFKIIAGAIVAFVVILGIVYLFSR